MVTTVKGVIVRVMVMVILKILTMKMVYHEREDYVEEMDRRKWTLTPMMWMFVWSI